METCCQVVKNERNKYMLQPEPAFDKGLGLSVQSLEFSLRAV